MKKTSKPKGQLNEHGKPRSAGPTCPPCVRTACGTTSTTSPTPRTWHASWASGRTSAPRSSVRGTAQGALHHSPAQPGRNGAGALGGLALPAASVAVAVTVCGPSGRGVEGVVRDGLAFFSRRG